MDAVCDVCVHQCKLSPGQWGFCRARKNEGGKIVCKNYGQVTSIALDPIFKKPLKMFCPGSLILSVGSFGCNLRCPFCQNHSISMSGAESAVFSGSQRESVSKAHTFSGGKEEKAGTFHNPSGGLEAETTYISPEDLVSMALKYKKMGNIGVAFTYNEPLIGWEYVRDTAVLVKKAGMKNVLVTNGTASPLILDKLLPFIDAMNIDLKGFTEDYYKKLAGSLEMVKDFIKKAAKDCHIELTTLIVPGENDGLSDMEREAQWIASISRDIGDDGGSGLGKIPLHITRFFPRYHMMDREATDINRIYELADAAGKYLKHVFTGNI